MFGIKDIYVTFENKRAASKSQLLLQGEWRNTIILSIVLTEHRVLIKARLVRDLIKTPTD